MNTWPMQSECDKFYGNPRSVNDPTRPSLVWEQENLVGVAPPFKVTYAGQRVSMMRMHKKCAESLVRVLSSIWIAAGKDQAVIDRWGMSIYAGAYTYRLMRRSNRLSMHAYGCAIDFDPERNGLGDLTPNFANCTHVVEAFENEGWTWGGRWGGRGRDGMHFQAARVD
jgi:hypothetical protein